MGWGGSNFGFGGGGNGGGGGNDKFPADLQVVLSGGKSFGKYTNGQTIPAQGKTAVQVIQDAVLQFIAPTISFSISSMVCSPSGLGTGITSGSYAEKGGVINTVNMPYGETPNSDTYLSSSVERDSLGPVAMPTPSGTYSPTGLGLLYTNSLSDRTLHFSVVFQISGTQTSQDVAKFTPPTFYGVGAANALSGANTVVDLATLFPGSKALRLTKGQANVSFSPVLQRYFWIYPASFGALTKIVDQNGFDVTASFTQSTKSFTLIDGSTSESYYVYESNADTTQTNFLLTFI